MRKPQHRNRIYLLVAIALLLTACSTNSQESLWLDPPGWSRAQFLGTTESTSPVPMALDPENNLYVGFFSAGDAAGMTIVKYSSQGELRWRVTKTSDRFVSGKHLQLIWHGGSLKALWINSGDLLQAELYPDTGEIQNIEVLEAERPVKHLSAAVSPGGIKMIAYSGSDDEPGVYLLNNSEYDDPILVDPAGINAEIIFDAYSNLHIAWLYKPSILQDAELRYTSFPNGNVASNPIIINFSTQYRTTDVIEGPYLGADLTHVYVGDTAMIRTGMREGEIETLYRTFPIWDPQAGITPDRLFVPTDFDLRYGEFSGSNDLQIGPRANWNELNRNTDQIVEVVSAGSPRSETMLAFHERVSTQSGQSQAQIGAITLQAGDPQGYQLITFTSTGSKQPNLLISGGGYVFLSWLELTDVRTYSVYVSTTVPTFMAGFDQLGFQEWKRMLIDMIFGMFSGLVLFPVAFLWMIPPLIAVASLSFVRRKEERLTQLGNVISLLAGLVVFHFFKFSIFPSLRTTVPFVRWIPVIPLSLRPVLQFGVPIMVAALSGLIAIAVIRRQGQTSAVMLFALYALIDGITTLMIYGGFLFGM